MYRRFIDGTDGPAIIAAAHEIDACLRKKDASADQLMELLKPKVQMPSTGATGAPLMDLTGGCPDTPQWIALMAILEQKNPFYGEYMSWIRRHAVKFNRQWFRAILTELGATDEKERVREQCQECLKNF